MKVHSIVAVLQLVFSHPLAVTISPLCRYSFHYSVLSKIHLNPLIGNGIACWPSTLLFCTCPKVQPSKLCSMLNAKLWRGGDLSIFYPSFLHTQRCQTPYKSREKDLRVFLSSYSKIASSTKTSEWNASQSVSQSNSRSIFYSSSIRFILHFNNSFVRLFVIRSWSASLVWKTVSRSASLLKTERHLTKYFFTYIRWNWYLNSHTAPSWVRCDYNRLQAWAWWNELESVGVTCDKQCSRGLYFHWIAKYT